MSRQPDFFAGLCTGQTVKVIGESEEMMVVSAWRKQRLSCQRFPYHCYHIGSLLKSTTSTLKFQLGFLKLADGHVITWWIPRSSLAAGLEQT